MSQFTKGLTGSGVLHEVEAQRFTTEASTSSHFSWIRTRMSIERTLMAVVRTSVSLIGFGFTIVQFFDRLHDMKGTMPAANPNAPRFLGLALIAGGVISALLAIGQYRGSIKYLWSPEFSSIAGITKEPTRTSVVFIAFLVAAIGVFAFGSVFIRLG
jgi:putative membrane protein